jgi:LCP family protein required for cell wall assembly
VAPVRREEVYTCLIFGMDGGYGNTDTIMVASFDVPNKKIGLISIPRDMVISLEREIAYNKINSVYGQGGVDRLKEEISQLLGIPLDFYVKVRLSAFEKLVNAVGGVYFDVPVDMHYFDPDQDLLIDLTAGPQTLTGEQAMQLVRFRQDNTGTGYGDVGRTHTQQEFLKAMLGQVLSEASLKDVPNLVDILRSYVEIDKNLSVNDMIYFGRELVGMDIGTAIRAVTLPCEWSSPYMWVKTDEALDTINTVLNPYTTDVTEEMVEFYSK